MNGKVDSVTRWVAVVALGICSVATAQGAFPTWQLQTASAGWQERRALGMQAFAGRLWVIGGQNDLTFEAFNDTWSSTDGTVWTQKIPAAPWAPRANHATAVFDGRLWVMGGGLDNNQSVNLHDVWSSVDGINWVPATSAAAWIGRRGLTTLVFAGKLWVIGGQNDLSFQAFNDVWSSSDGTTWNQEIASSPWPARSHHASVVFHDRIWIMGGGLDNDQTTNFNDVWSSADGIAWSQATGAAAWSSRRGLAAVVFNDKIWVLGGQNDRTFQAFNDVWSSSDGITWIASPPAPWSPRNNHGAAILNDRICIGGGGLDNNQLVNLHDVWCTAAAGDAVALPTLSKSTIALYCFLLVSMVGVAFSRRRR